MTEEAQRAGANLRLTLFQWATRLAAVILLAGAGFAELYLARATFGASLADYFALLAWGFGAEATRAAATDLLRTWGVPMGTNSPGA